MRDRLKNVCCLLSQCHSQNFVNAKNHLDKRKKFSVVGAGRNGNVYPPRLDAEFPNEQRVRMSRETFLFVCHELKSIEKRNTSMRKAIPLQKRVSIALWFRTISHLFGVSKASVCLIIKDVCVCIVDHLLPKYIRMPCGDALKQVVAGFKGKIVLWATTSHTGLDVYSLKLSLKDITV